MFRSSKRGRLAVFASCVAAALGVTASVSLSAGASAPDGGELRILTYGEPRSMNCAVVVAYDQIISTAFVERMVTTDADYQPTKDGLVSDWERVDDRTWRVTAREGVTFSNGEAWNAEALQFSIETHRVTDGSVKSFFAPIESTAVVDDHVVEIVTTEPNNAIPAILAFGCGFPPEYYESVGADGFGLAPLGTGPFVLEEWTPGQGVRATAHADYWRGAPQLDRISWTFVADESARTDLLLTGEGDLALNLPFDRVDEIEAAGLSTLILASGTQLNIQMNKEAPPFDDPALREAVQLAVDPGLIVESLFGGDGVGATTAPGFFPPVYQTSAEELPAPDMDAARELVASTGESPAVTLRYTQGRYPKDAVVAEAVAGLLEEAGFTVERVPLDGSEFFAQKNTPPGFDGLWIAAGAAVLPHPVVLSNAFLSSAATTQYCTNVRYDELNVEGMAAADDVAMREAYTEVENIVLHEDRCFMPLYSLTNVYGFVPELTGLNPQFDTLLNYWELSLSGS